MTESLPVGWGAVPVRDLFTFNIGGVWGDPPGHSEVDVKVLRVTEFQPNGTVRFSSAAKRSVTKKQLESRRLLPNDLLIEKSGGGPTQPVGRVVRVPPHEQDAIPTNFVQLLRPNYEVTCPSYLFWLLQNWYTTGRSIPFQTASTNIRNLKTMDYLGQMAPLPPFAEQERIVASIEEYFSRVNVGIDSLRRARRNARRLRTFVLEAAVRGCLVGPTIMDVDRRFRPDQSKPESGTVPYDLPDSWTWVAVADVADVQGGITKSPKRRPNTNAFPFLRVANVGRDRLDLTDLHEIELFAGEIDRYRLQPGDLLVVEGNGSPNQIGRSALWEGGIDTCVHQNHLIRVRPGAALTPEYLNIFWNSPTSVIRLRGIASSTTGLYTLSTGKIRSFLIAVPPVQEQELIAKAVYEQISRLDLAMQTLDETEQRVHDLRRSILSQAFIGGLSRRDSNDEPVSVLLDRIACRRETSATTQSRRRVVGGSA